MKYKPSRYNIVTELSNGTTVLYNFFTNGLDEIEPDDLPNVQYILQNCNEEMDGHLAELKQYMIENHYLISSEVNEHDMIRTRNMSRRFDHRHHTLTVMPTLDCNFACTYCYETREKGFIGREAVEGIKNWVRQNAPVAKYLGINWFGGEPLLDFSLIEEVNQFALEACGEHHCKFSSVITTNGYLFTDEMLAKVDALKLRKIQITLDGTAEYHNRQRPLRNGEGSFDQVFRNILKVLDQTSAIIQLLVNINKENYRDIPALMDLFPEQYRTPRLKIYFRNIFVTPEQGRHHHEMTGQLNQDQQVLRDLYLYGLQHGFHVTLPVAFVKDYHCESCLKNHYVLHPSGEIFKCTVGFEPERRVGRISSTGEFDIDYPAISRWLSHVPGDDPECYECILLPVCQGGCRYQRLIGKKVCPYEKKDLKGLIEMIYFYTMNQCSEE